MFDAHAPLRSVAHADARGVAVLCVALVALAAAMAWLSADVAGLARAALLTLGALSAALGLGLAAAWGAALRTAARAQGAFHALHGASDAPAFLTDAQGAVIGANGSQGAVIGANGAQAGEVGAPVAHPLAACSADPAALVYRLIQRARAGESAAEIAAPPDGRRAHAVTAMRLGSDRMIWTAAPLPPEPAAPAVRFGPETLMDSLPVALTQLSPEGEIIAANAAARALLGDKATPGAQIGGLVEGLGRSMEVRLAEAMRGDSSGRAEIARSQPDGRDVFLQVALTRAEIGGETCLIAVLNDATELKTLEQQFVQSQKMQAVGQLAGGVAHDFNNLLTAITGHTDLLLQRHDLGDLDYADLTQVRQNANRAAGLVRQLLAFSRKQTLTLTVVNLADALTETSHLLNRLLGERVSLRIEHAPDLGLVKIDERQFEQVVMNLVVNARDAMPRGGEVLIRTENARVEAEQRRGRAVMPKGDYVRIDVIDRGAGIPPDRIDQIFEPFFTTKPVGEGTGLGLSTVYGIVKQTGGFIFADNAPEGGAIFSIYLPRMEKSAQVAAPPPKVAPVSTDLTGRGVVLLIEDETPVRAFAARALKLRGYEVLEAASGEEALDILADPALAIDVIVSDVVMPGMDGPSCVREARKGRPDVRVVFVSGYAEDALKRSMGGIGACHFLAKPFSLNELTAKVKECLAA